MKKHLILLITTLVCAFSYAQSSVEAIQTDTPPKPQTEVNEKPPKFRVSAQAGFGYRTAAIQPDWPAPIKRHAKQLKTNLSFGADVSYFFYKNIGIGVKYNGISGSANSRDLPFVLDDGSTIDVSLSEKIGIHYIGGFLGIRHFTKENKLCFFANAGGGYVRFVDNGVSQGIRAIITGNTGAFLGEIGFDYFATKRLAIGLQVSFTAGVLKNITTTVGKVSVKEALDKADHENISHIDISLGFRFYK